MGQLSRQVDTQKVDAQVLVALTGTAFFWAGVYGVERLFREGGPERLTSIGPVLLKFSFNALAALFVFWGFRWWVLLWMTWQRGKFVRGDD